MKVLMLMLLLGFSFILKGNTYYVSTTGNDLHSGIITQPWGTWQKAFNTARAGDTVYFRGGVWQPSGMQTVSIQPRTEFNLPYAQATGHDGDSLNYIHYFAYPGEKPVLDCANVIPDNGYIDGIFMAWANYIHLKGLTIRNVRDNNQFIHCHGINVYGGSNIIIEECVIHDVDGEGISLSMGGGYTSSGSGIGADTTIVRNTDIYNCWNHVDLGSGVGGWADGIKANSSSYKDLDGVIIIDSCRVWNCSDDGLDPGGLGLIQISNNWIFDNGHLDGDGCAIKTGGGNTTEVSFINRLIYKNLMVWNIFGISLIEYPEYYRLHARVYNNTIYNNRTGISISRNDTHVNSETFFYNNMVWKATDNDAAGRDAIISSYYESVYHASNNTFTYAEMGSIPPWNWNHTITVTDADFVLIDTDPTDSIAAYAQLTAPRVNGKLPATTFLKLAPTSDLIDAGTASIPNINNITFYGSAPDIGYSEYSTGSVTLPMPNFVNAIAENSTPTRVDITFSLTLANIVPITSAFTVMVNSSVIGVSSVSISGSKVLLTLTSPIIFGDIVTVSYTKPSTNPLQTAAGGQAASITSKIVTNNIAPVIPLYVSAVIENATPGRLDISYSITLANIVPAASAFTVMVNSSTRGVSSVTISGSKVLLTLSSPIIFGDIVTVAYAKPSTNPLQAAAGGQATTQIAQPVINNCSLIPNQPPVISITSPTKSNSYASPANITIDVTAYDPDGTISKVEFFNGSVKIGERTSAPYSFIWKEVADGTYLLTAVATDNSNSKTVSDPVSATVAKSVTVPNQLPVVTITSPDNKKKIKKNENIVIEVLAVDPDGIISKVELKNGNTTLAEWVTSPYSFTWEGMDEGIYEITAIATDNSGATSVSPMVELTIDPEFDAGSEIINLYPNPNNGKFYVDLISGIQVEIPIITVISITGEIIYHETMKEGESLKQIDISDFSPGTYILLVTNGSSIAATKKFIKN